MQILTSELCVLATITPLCQGARLSIFTDLLPITSLSNDRECLKKTKKTEWPDHQLLFEMDPDYQNKVSYDTAGLGKCLVKG